MQLARFDYKPGIVDGVVFRSMLEARWAKFFSLIGLQWIYEPETFNRGKDQYRPDFLVEGLGYVEIKPEIRFLEESGKRITECLGMLNKPLYVFACPSVAFRGAVLALFKDDKIYALEELHVLKAICEARKIRDYPKDRELYLNAVSAAIQNANSCKIEQDSGVGLDPKYDAQRQKVRVLSEQFKKEMK